MDRIVGLGEYAITGDTEDIIKTFALSSCVALTVYSPIKRVLGMVHIVLPDSEILRNKVVVDPAYYADTAVPMMIHKICHGYCCNKEELKLMIFGGAMSTRKGDIFNIGLRNTETIKSVLERMNLKVYYSDIGGYMARSIMADVATGTVRIMYRPLNI